MPETKPPVSQTKTAEQWMRKNKMLLPGPLDDCDWELIRILLEAYAESELAALREQLAEAALEINCAGPIAHRIRILKAENQAKLSASERIAEGLAKRLEWALPKLAHKPDCMTCLPTERWKAEGSWIVDKCSCGIAEAESVLARYQAQKGQP